MPQDHWLPGFNFNVEEWDTKGGTYETLAICRTLELARAAFKVAIAEKPAGYFMIRQRTRVVKPGRRLVKRDARRWKRRQRQCYVTPPPSPLRPRRRRDRHSGPDSLWQRHDVCG